MRLGLRFSLAEVGEVEPVTLAADVIRDAVVGAGWLAVAVNFRYAEPRLIVIGNLSLFGLINALKYANTVRKMSENAS